MGSNRKQPFGYTMKFGRIEIHQEEAKCVMQIFLKYNQGASFKELAEMMQKTSVAYACDLLKVCCQYMHKILEQSFEIDADSSAVCMLINLLMYDCVSSKVIDKQKYVKDQIVCIMAALAIVFC